MANALRISSDTFDNPTSQHATEVEPALAAHDATVVAAFQVGRFYFAGASGIGYATSADSGRTWRSGVLPGLTRVQSPKNPFDSASDPNVAFDAAHGDWLIASLPVLDSGGPTPGALVSRSVDGITWTNPVFVGSGQGSADKTWLACDDGPASPFYGHCYVEWDDPNAGDLVHLSTSSDGGAHWGKPLLTEGSARGLGGQPVVQPGGDVVVPMNDPAQAHIIAFTSTNGGASWNAPATVAQVTDHLVAGDLRTSPLPSAAVDDRGFVYVVWQDCRFRSHCRSNDMVLSTSSDGATWTNPVRIPIDPLSSRVDHFIPGLAADPQSGGPTARLSLAYYFYPVASCSAATCRLHVGFVGSADGGVSWSEPQTFGRAMSLGWLPLTRDGLMVGDYIATAFVSGAALAAFAVAGPLQGLLFDEAMYVPAQPPSLWEAGPFRRTGAERAIPGIQSDHASRPPRPDDD